VSEEEGSALFVTVIEFCGLELVYGIAAAIAMVRETDSACRRATLWAWWAERWVVEGAEERFGVLSLGEGLVWFKAFRCVFSLHSETGGLFVWAILLCGGLEPLNSTVRPTFWETCLDVWKWGKGKPRCSFLSVYLYNCGLLLEKGYWIMLSFGL
jgi:hypothetical protein